MDSNSIRLTASRRTILSELRRTLLIYAAPLADLKRFDFRKPNCISGSTKYKIKPVWSTYTIGTLSKNFPAKIYANPGYSK